MGKKRSSAKASGSQTLLRGLDVIDALIDGSLSAWPNCPKSLELTRSTTHRLASALVERRLLVVPARAKAIPSVPNCWSWATAASQQMHLPQRGSPLAGAAVGRRPDDTVHLGVLDGRPCALFGQGGGAQAHQHRLAPGRTSAPSSSTGLGKALILDKTEAATGSNCSYAEAGPRAYDSSARAVWLERMHGYAVRRATPSTWKRTRIRSAASPRRSARVERPDRSPPSACPRAAQYMSDARMEPN